MSAVLPPPPKQGKPSASLGPAAANAAAASFAALTAKLDYLDAHDIELVRRAYRFADEAHLGQMRNSGEPYITHPIAVAAQCAEWKLDAQALMAALLHDAMEDCGVTKHELIERFGAPWQNWSTASPSWTSCSSTRAKKVRPSHSGKCSWPWRAMYGSF
jgi:guanosine-3',5'-bis(diphosphate) 3'-pyrophosphohydrolase